MDGRNAARDVRCHGHIGLTGYERELLLGLPVLLRVVSIAEAREGLISERYQACTQRRCADVVAADTHDGEYQAGRTRQGVPRQEHAGQQWHRGHHRRRERLLGEIADVWQPRRVVGIRAGVVMVRLVGCLVVKDARRQADGG